MYRPEAMVVQFKQRLIDQTVDIPFVFPATHLWQVHRFLHQPAKCSRLRQRLPVHLPYPGRRPVGRNHHQRHLPVKSLGHSRMEVQQSRPGRAAHSHGMPPLQSQPDGKKARTAFIRHRIALEIIAGREGLHQRHVPASGAQHDLANAISPQQGHELQHVLFISISHLKFLWRLRISWFAVSVPSPSIRLPAQMKTTTLRRHKDGKTHHPPPTACSAG